MEAGMDDFLVKPIDPDAMWAMLTRWVRPRQPQLPAVPALAGAAGVTGAAEMSAPASSPAVGDDGVPVGVAGLDTVLGLTRMMQKKSLYIAMLKRYLAGQQHVVREIAMALAAGDNETAFRVAHTSKAVAGNIGASQVQHAAQALESALGSSAPAEVVSGLLIDLENLLGPLVRDLGLIFPDTPPQK